MMADFQLPAHMLHPKLEAQLQPRRDSPVGPTKSSGDMAVLRQTVNRQAAMLQYYQLKYPQESHGSRGGEMHADVQQLINKLQVMSVVEVVQPLLAAYDDKLAHSQQLIKELEDGVKHTNFKCRQLIQQNQDLQRGDQLAAELRKRVDQLLAENEFLVEEQRRTEPLIRESFAMERQLVELQDRTTQEESQVVTAQHREIGELRGRVYELQQQLQESQAKANNLRQKFDTDSQELVDMRERDGATQQEMRKIRHWFAVSKARLEEFDQCCTEVNIVDWLQDYQERAAQDDSQDEDPILFGDGLLYKCVRRMKREHAESIKQLAVLVAEHQQLSKVYSELVQRYNLDMERANANVQSLKSHLELSLQAQDQAQYERDSALKHAHSANHDITTLQDQLRDLQRRRAADTDQLLLTHREQVQSLREEWESQRAKLLQEINETRRSKTDLQVEIGWLLRERKSGDADLSRALKQLNVQRDTFKRRVAK